MIRFEENETTRGLNVAIYARTSTPRQASTPQQVDLCRRLCDQRNHKVRFILKDEGQSAATDERPGYQRLIELANEGRIDAVVVWKLDRLVRNLRHLLNIHHEFEEANVAIISYTEQFDTSTAFGRFAFRNMASAAELEREIIGERSRLGRYNMALQGRWPGNNVPLGYDLGDDRRLCVNKGDARTVQQIFHWYKSRVPLTEISVRLDAAGIRGKNGANITTSHLSRIVRNPLYIGRLEILEVHHERPDLRIIQNRTWRAAKARWGKRVDDGGGRRRREVIADKIFAEYFRYIRQSGS